MKREPQTKVLDSVGEREKYTNLQIVLLFPNHAELEIHAQHSYTNIINFLIFP